MMAAGVENPLSADEVEPATADVATGTRRADVTRRRVAAVCALHRLRLRLRFFCVLVRLTDAAVRA